MLLEKFKTSKKIEIGKTINEYVKKHYDMNAAKSIESLCNEIEFARNSVISFNDKDKSTETLLKWKGVIIEYLKLLNTVRQRMSFGKDGASVKLQFSWIDVLKKDNYSSYSFAFEYYSNLLNLEEHQHKFSCFQNQFF